MTEPFTAEDTITDAEVLAYLGSKHNRELLVALLQCGVHQLVNGNAILSFDHEGKLRKIKMEQVVYKS